MGYQIADVTLRDGRVFHQVVIVQGTLTEIRGIPGIPFTEPEIVDIAVTHDRWDFRR